MSPNPVNHCGLCAERAREHQVEMTYAQLYEICQSTLVLQDWGRLDNGTAWIESIVIDQVIRFPAAVAELLDVHVSKLAWDVHHGGRSTVVYHFPCILVTGDSVTPDGKWLSEERPEQ